MPSISTNSNYIVVLTQGGSGGNLSVTANAAAKLGLRIQNKWTNIMEALGLSSDSGSGIIAAAISGGQLFSGDNFLPTIATSHVWRGGSGIELELQFRFDAWDSTSIDVLKPVQTLIQIFGPSRGGAGSSVGGFITGAASILGADISNSFLHPPGPTPKEYLFGNAQIGTCTVQLGKVMTIPNLIPVDLSWEFEERFDTQGNPVCALITASFISYTLPSRADLLAFFNTSATAAAQTAATNAAGAAAAAMPNSNPGASPTGGIGVGVGGSADAPNTFGG